MKKSLNILAICFLIFIGAAEANDDGTDKTLALVKSRYDNVKVYAQASTASELVAVLKKNESLGYYRTSILNGGGWSIVYINGRPGYVLSAEIYGDPKLALKNQRKKNKKVKTNMYSKVK